LTALATVNEATELSQGSEPAAFWFPAHVDSRGRLYAYGTGLNPHGDDLSRNLLRFANGKPIGERKPRLKTAPHAPPACGPTALAAYVAGAFGRDKLSWGERIRWTEDNEKMLRRIAEDPLGNRAEWEAEADGDGIWSALAAAREWTDYLDSGRSSAFVTKLPCYIDGTCNGLQHFAALARDEILGRSVNLLPRGDRPDVDGPSDIYQTVADRLLDLVHEARDHGLPEDRRAANLWLRLRPFKGNKAPRSIAKQAVMTKPYGATFEVMLKEVHAFWEAANGPEEWRDVQLQDDEDETEVRKLRGWLAKKLQAALGDTAGSANEIMEWLKASTRLMLKHRVEIAPPWRTPSGWPWLSKYQSIDEKTHVLKQPGERPREFSTYTENLTKPDKRKQAAGIAPNFVQGLDAAALMLAVSKMTGDGVHAVTTIHDSVGCLAPDMPVVARAVREGFAETHEANPLASYREAVLAALPMNDKARAKLPPLPKQGTLDIRRVPASEYLFC
jgi:DNA-directed RNA polymerase